MKRIGLGGGGAGMYHPQSANPGPPGPPTLEDAINAAGGATAWYRPEDLVDNAGSVGDWIDGSGNGNTATELGSTPLYVADWLGTGVPAADCSAGGYFKNAGWSQGSDSTPQTIISVYDIASPFGTSYVYDGLNSPSTDRVNHYQTNNNINFSAGSAVAITPNTFTTNQPRITLHHTGTATGGPTAAGGSVEQNGEGPTPIPANSQGTNALDGITLGAAFTGGAGLSGSIAEVIVFPVRITDAEALVIMDILRTKYGVNAP